MPRADRRCSRWLLVCSALAACQGKTLVLGLGHDAPQAGASAPDAGMHPQDAAAGRAPDAGAPADGLPRFAAPRLIEELVPADDAPDDDPSLSADRLLLCFNSKRDGGTGGEDIWCSERASTRERWGAPTPLTGLNSDERETGIALALDGLTLWFSSDRDDRDSLDVFVSRRESRTAAWSTPEHVAELSSDADDLVSAVAADRRTLYLARRESEDYDLYVATRAEAAASWQAPEPLSELNTDADESDAYPVSEGRGLVFTRDEDLQLARRTSAGERFAAPQPLAALNSAQDDRDAWAEPDLSYVVFSSERSGEYRLYETTLER